MKWLDHPAYDDNDILENLSTNKKLGSYPRLRFVLDNILAQYDKYRANGGNPWQVAALGIADPLKSNLINHYDIPPDDLSYLEIMREQLSPDVCPMCGSFYPATLDHVLPKTNYPEFAFFSQNLVPACFCNQKKGVSHIGANQGERVLHPYFDNFMANRLVRVEILEPFAAPSLSLVTCCGNIPELPAVNYHLQNVIQRTNIINVMTKRWGNLVREPRRILSLNEGVINEVEVRTSLHRKLTENDAEYSTPNNWNSFFYAGALESQGVIQWLTVHINKPAANAI